MAKHCVILLHGYFGTDTTLNVLERRLRAEGYDVLNIDYPSRKMDFAALADEIHPAVEKFLADHPTSEAHFVGHSMGGLVIRHYLHRHPCAQLKRTVMLGTPNEGSADAEKFLGKEWARAIAGPALEQFLPGYSHPDLPPGVEAGVIAGRISLNPVHWLEGRKSDGVVDLESTRLKTPHAHTILWTGHITMPINPLVLESVVRFLHTGQFEEQARGRA